MNKTKLKKTPVKKNTKTRAGKTKAPSRQSTLGKILSFRWLKKAAR
jgi:hypothetical protein